MKNKLLRFARFIIGDLEIFNVYHRNFNALNIFFCLLGICILIFSYKKLNSIEIIAISLFTLGFGLIYMTSRFVRKKKFWVFLVVSQVFFTYLVFISKGFNGTGVFLFIICYAASASIAEKQNRWLVLWVNVFYFSILYSINHLYPHFFVEGSYADTNLKWIFFFVIALSVGYIINSLKYNFELSTGLLKKQKNEINSLYTEIKESINYASSIQKALLPDTTKIGDILPEHFIFYRPKDIVSGDFYWVNKVENKIIVATADCTGHGVPGAFMSMLGISLLNEIVLNRKCIGPNEILNELRINVKKNIPDKNDGMDIAIVSIDMKLYKAEFSGANLSLYIIRNGKLIEYKPDRQPVGQYPSETSFTLQEINVEPGDMFYLFSDGYRDQVNGEYKKFKSKNFKELLLKVSEHPLSKQKQELERAFEQWKNSFEQNRILSMREIDNLFLSFKLVHLINRKSKLLLINKILKLENRTIENTIECIKEEIPDIKTEFIKEHFQTTNEQTDDVMVIGFRI